MKVKVEERITWIPDSRDLNDDAAYEKHRNFVHSFGMKCDSVGWTDMLLKGDESKNILKEIRKRADEWNLDLRCYYEKEYSEFEADWYILKPRYELNIDYQELENNSYDKKCFRAYSTNIKAYKIPKSVKILELWGDEFAVHEDFKACCEKHGFTGIDFIYINDKGKYRAPAYYSAEITNKVNRITTIGTDMEKNRYRKKVSSILRQISFPKVSLSDKYKASDDETGMLPLIGQLFDSIEKVELPVMIDPKGMPDSDFASIRIGNVDIRFVKKAVAEILISENVISSKECIPVRYFDEEKHAVLFRNGASCPTMPNEYIEKMETIKALNDKKLRPEYRVTEKMALTMLKKAKRENRNDYKKGVTSKKAEMADTVIMESLLPYYKIANGGMISDEIEIFGYENIEAATTKFRKGINNEELLGDIDLLMKCNVIGRAVNGDDILLTGKGKVIRFSHEDPALSEEWESITAFFYENIEI